ncbi:hypothetical protein QU874_29320, partial [Klebsiella pneumoniae]|uniref:hypothetical protein n=1 Tax=Klebsiella pneumoniae TaxID=573 RepID=UPI0038BB4AC1
VVVRNADGDSRPVAVAVKRKKVELRPPAVALADGTGDRTTDRPTTAVRLRVTSETPLDRVEVWRAGAAGDAFERAAAVDLGPAAKGEDGFT